MNKKTRFLYILLIATVFVVVGSSVPTAFAEQNYQQSESFKYVEDIDTDVTTEHTSPHCEECSEELLEKDGKFFCPSCDSLSGFELTPQEDEFKL